MFKSIVIEGIDGCGKTPFINLLLEDLTNKYPKKRIFVTNSTSMEEKYKYHPARMFNYIISGIRKNFTNASTQGIFDILHSEIHRFLMLTKFEYDIVIFDRFYSSNFAYGIAFRDQNLVDNIFRMKYIYGNFLPDIGFYIYDEVSEKDDVKVDNPTYLYDFDINSDTYKKLHNAYMSYFNLTCRKSYCMKKDKKFIDRTDNFYIDIINKIYKLIDGK